MKVKVDNILLTNLSAKGGAVLDDPLQLFMNQLDAAQAGFLQTLNLPLYQQLEGHLGHKECRSWTLQGESSAIIYPLSAPKGRE